MLRSIIRKPSGIVRSFISKIWDAPAAYYIRLELDVWPQQLNKINNLNNKIYRVFCFPFSILLYNSSNMTGMFFANNSNVGCIISFTHGRELPKARNSNI